MGCVMLRYLCLLGVLVVIIIQLYFYQESLKREHFLQLQISGLQKQVIMLGQQVETLEESVDALNETPLNDMVDHANKAILDGWESLLNTVDREVQKARDSLQQKSDADEGAVAPQQSSP